MQTDVDRDALMQRVRDAIEDAGLYEPSDELVEAIYEQAVRPLAVIVGRFVAVHGSDAIAGASMELAQQCAFRQITTYDPWAEEA